MSQVKITKSDLHSAYWRSFFDMASINYERFQTLGYLFSLQKVLKKLYADDKEGLTRACVRHMEMFNTMPLFIPSILGTTIAIEEKVANSEEGEDTAELEESINNIKVGLMGPFAGIGDSLGWGTVRPVLASVGAAMALGGSVLGPIFFLVMWNLFNFSFRYFTLIYGYNKGTSMMRDIKTSNIIEKISTGASILGLMVLGVLVASWINIKTVLELTVEGPDGPVVTNIQAVLDGLIPGLLGLGLTMLLVAMMRRKWTTTRLIVLIFVASLILFLAKIAA
jgi:PTS system mannose-specific IID component